MEDRVWVAGRVLQLGEAVIDEAGPVLVQVAVLLFGDLKPNQTVAMAPVTRRSGSSIKGETRSQRGNHALESALFLSAFASLSDPSSRAYYDRKKAEKKRHNAALICRARRRIDVIYAMLRDRKPYQHPATPEPEPSPLAA